MVRMTSRGTWKNQERRVGRRYFGVERTPLSGGNSGHDTTSDTLSKEFYVEARYRSELTVIRWYLEIISKAKAESKIPVLALKSKESNKDYFLIRADHLEGFCKKFLNVKTKLKSTRSEVIARIHEKYPSMTCSMCNEEKSLNKVYDMLYCRDCVVKLFPVKDSEQSRKLREEWGWPQKRGK